MSKKILLVDDDAKNIMLLKDVLEISGYTTVVAWNGAEAVTLATSEVPDLILMDIQMPVLNGIEATRQIKADPALADIPIYAVTASVMAEQCQAAREAGVDDVISKPIDIKSLVAQVNAIFSGASDE